MPSNRYHLVLLLEDEKAVHFGFDDKTALVNKIKEHVGMAGSMYVFSGEQLRIGWAKGDPTHKLLFEEGHLPAKLWDEDKNCYEYDDEGKLSPEPAANKEYAAVTTKIADDEMDRKMKEGKPITVESRVIHPDDDDDNKPL